MIITKETVCMICRKMISDGSMVLIKHGFVCEECCMELALSEVVDIKPSEKEKNYYF